MSRRTVPRVCRKCQRIFDAPVSQVKIGRGLFCSRKCRLDDSGRLLWGMMRKPPPPEVKQKEVVDG